MAKITNYWIKQSQKRYEEVRQEEIKRERAKVNRIPWADSANPVLERYAPSHKKKSRMSELNKRDTGLTDQPQSSPGQGFDILLVQATTQKS